MGIDRSVHLNLTEMVRMGSVAPTNQNLEGEEVIGCRLALWH